MVGVTAALSVSLLASPSSLSTATAAPASGIDPDIPRTGEAHAAKPTLSTAERRALATAVAPADWVATAASDPRCAARDQATAELADRPGDAAAQSSVGAGVVGGGPDDVLLVDRLQEVTEVVHRWLDDEAVDAVLQLDYSPPRVVVHVAAGSPAAAATQRLASCLPVAVATVETPPATVRAATDLLLSEGFLDGVQDPILTISPDELNGRVVVRHPEGFDFSAAQAAALDAVETAHPGLLVLSPFAEESSFEYDVRCSYPSRNECSTPIRGGQDIVRSDGAYCTSGFMVRGRSGNVYTLTAGHCGGSSWRYIYPRESGGFSSATLGPVHRNYLGQNADAMLVDSDLSYRGKVIDEREPGSDRFDTISYQASLPALNTYVCMTGTTTGTTCGEVTDRGEIAVIQGNRVSLVVADYCRAGGDSGGPVWSGGSIAYGIHSGSYGGARTCGNAWFQPLDDPALGDFSVEWI